MSKMVGSCQHQSMRSCQSQDRHVKTIRHCTSVVVLSVLVLAMPSHVSHSFHFPFGNYQEFGFVICNVFHDFSTMISWKKRSPLVSRANRRCLRWMNRAKGLLTKDLLERPLELKTVELAERALKGAWLVGADWSSPWGDALRSLKPHGFSPERVLDSLCLLFESNDEVLQKMDLDDITMEHLTAGHNALQELIGKVELALKKGRRGEFVGQVAPWVKYLSTSWWPCLGSKALTNLQAMDARARILMTQLEDEAQKENHTTCLQEVASTQLAFCFLTPQMTK